MSLSVCVKQADVQNTQPKLKILFRNVNHYPKQLGIEYLQNWFVKQKVIDTKVNKFDRS